MRTGVWSKGGRVVQSLGISFLMLTSVLVLFIPSSDNVRGDSIIYADGDLDGYILHYTDFGDMTYPPYTHSVIQNASPFIPLGQADYGYSYVSRGWVSFDTSSIPDDANIQSVALRIRGSIDWSTTDFDVRIWRTDYTAWSPDWNASGGLQGTLLNSASFVVGAWYSLTLNAASVNLTGLTGFLLNSSKDSNTPPTNEEGLSFYSANTSSPPELIIDYVMSGTPISIELDAGAWTTWLNTTAFPEVSEWNLTYDLYYFALDTVPSSKNMTISKLNSSWTFKAVQPVCNYTETDAAVLLSDVYDSICYRVWFTVAKASPYATVHLSLFNAFTGEGFFWEQMKVQVCDGSSWDNTTAESVATPDFFVELEQTYTIRVLDYFGNMLVDYSFSANAEDVYLTVPVPYYSWQIFNMNEAPVLMSIYWNNSGSPWQFFVGPQWIIERFLKGGNYTFMVTFYNTDGTAGSTVYYNRTVPYTGLNASFIYVNGTTLYEIISSVEGVMATQQIITSLVSPSVILVYEDLPMAPAKLKSLSLKSSLAIDPYLILEATVFQNDTGLAGVNSTLWLPHPSVTGATYYILSDVLTFQGTHATTLYINQTDGTNLLTSAVLPATFVLSGQNITVWGDVAYSVSRATTFREITEYTVNYYSTQKKYEAVLSFNNSCSFDFYAPYWFIGFPNLTAIDPDTVTLFDLDNGLYLSQRTNFEVSSSGVHLTLIQLNSSAQRNFRITYWDENGTTGIGAPNLIAEAYTQGTYGGASMKYTAVQWANPWSVAYVGEVYITLNFTYGNQLLLSSIHVLDETTGREIPNSQWVYTGRTLIILTDGVGSVPVGGSRNYGIYFTIDYATTEERSDFFFGPIIYQGKMFYISTFAVSWSVILILVGWAVVGLAWWNDKPGATSYIVMMVAITVILMYLKTKLG